MNGNAVSDPAEPALPVFGMFLQNCPWCCPSWRYPSEKCVDGKFYFLDFVFLSLGLVHLTEDHHIACFGEICFFAVFSGERELIAKYSLDTLDVTW